VTQFTRAWNIAKVIKLPSHCSFFVFAGGKIEDPLVTECKKSDGL
jgi:hypothetical protein